MKHLFATLLALKLVTGCGLCLRGQATSEYETWSIPSAISDLFTKSPLSKTHEFTYEINPFYIHADFNGDHKLDTAILVKEKSTGKLGIAIFHGGSTRIILLGAGRKSGAGSASDSASFSWMNYWHIFPRGGFGHGSQEGPPMGFKMKGDGIIVGHAESASRLLYWTGKKYAYQQLGD